MFRTVKIITPNGVEITSDINSQIGITVNTTFYANPAPSLCQITIRGITQSDAELFFKTGEICEVYVGDNLDKIYRGRIKYHLYNPNSTANAPAMRLDVVMDGGKYSTLPFLKSYGENTPIKTIFEDFAIANGLSVGQNDIDSSLIIKKSFNNTGREVMQWLQDNTNCFVFVQNNFISATSRTKPSRVNSVIAPGTIYNGEVLQNGLIKVNSMLNPKILLSSDVEISTEYFTKQPINDILLLPVNPKGSQFTIVSVQHTIDTIDGDGSSGWSTIFYARQRVLN